MASWHTGHEKIWRQMASMPTKGLWGEIHVKISKNRFFLQTALIKYFLGVKNIEQIAQNFNLFFKGLFYIEF